MRLHRFAVVGAAVVAMSMTGCSSGTPVANQDYCDAVDAAQSDMSELKTMLAGGYSLADIRDQIDMVKVSTNAARSEADDLKESIRSDIDAADAAFEDAVSNIPSDSTLTEAVTTFRQAIGDWESSVSQIRSEVGC